MSTLSSPPSTTAPTIVSTAPTAMNGVAAPSSLRRSSTAPTPRNATPRTSATADVVPVVSPESDSGVSSVDNPKSVLELPLEISPWNGMRLSVAPATSKVSQLAKKISVPARKIARPLRPTQEVEHEVAREREQVDAAGCRRDLRRRRRRARRTR